MEKKEIAANQFLNGYRCSQAVFDVFAPDFGLDPDLAKKISIALAGGSGAGGECGAVSAAYLVIGLKYGFSHPGDPEKFKAIIKKNSEFIEKFKSLHGDIDCSKLIGLEIFSQEGQQEFKEKNIKETHCVNFVKDAVTNLEKIMAE
ncbi:MAG: C_GCAxxG_C_C family protein [Desulfobacteraceae bacterium]|nr:C_GCAxxG_C_C family protein [Desulfobacteraceae bacterium]